MRMEEKSPESSSGSKAGVPGLERGLRILSTFSERSPYLTASQIGSRCKIKKSTLFRTLRTLESYDYIKKHSDGRYGLGVSVLSLGFQFLASQDITEVGRPIIEKVRDATGFSCNLAIRNSEDAVIVAKASSPSPYRSHLFVGSRLPVYASLLGRTLLLDETIESLKKMYQGLEVRQHTKKTPLSYDELYNIILKDRERGFASDQEYYESNIAGIATPVRAKDGRIVAAMGITFTVHDLSSLSEDERLSLCEVLIKSSHELEKSIG